ncbi:hypothetical protein K2173_009774 [Erythroxylum novogranatense]|uniref:MADS-box domain-containing protein n=1 Tax=Erythroxylum novogranatense TaxID=1862640 RepID=A0AAV8SYX5_9ROSI|nr:hypothetical protein K2173_009774 [Erythroxylum novogranatense]
MEKRKAGTGRQKVAMEKIHKKSNLQVTFCKRRAGLFKKASELCTLCGVEVAIVVFSPAGKPFAFGHPEVNSIVDKFLARNPHRITGSHQLMEAHRNANVRELNMQLTFVLEQLEMERKKGQLLDQIREATRRQSWWESSIDLLGLIELEQLREAMAELKKSVAEQANKVMAESANSFPFLVNRMGIVGSFENKFNGVSGDYSSVPRGNYFGHGQGSF